MRLDLTQYNPKEKVDNKFIDNPELHSGEQYPVEIKPVMDRAEESIERKVNREFSVWNKSVLNWAENLITDVYASNEKIIKKNNEDKIVVPSKAKIKRELESVLSEDDFDIDMSQLSLPMQNAVGYSFDDIKTRLGGEAVTSAVFEGLGVSFDIQYEMSLYREILKARQSELAGMLYDTTVELIPKVIERGIKEGLSIDDISKSLETVLGVNRVRAQRIARSEVNWAINEAIRQQTYRLGIRKYQLDPAPDACGLCQKRAVGTFTYSQAMDLLPSHPNCRCVLRSVIPDRWLEIEKSLKVSAKKKEKEIKDTIGEEVKKTIEDKTIKTAVDNLMKEGVVKLEEAILQTNRGRDGRDGYTPVKNKDYFDGKDADENEVAKKLKSSKDFLKKAKGPKGDPGKDGITTTIIKEEDLSADEIVDRIEGQKGDKRLDVLKLRNLDKLKKERRRELMVATNPLAASENVSDEYIPKKKNGVGFINSAMYEIEESIVFLKSLIIPPNSLQVGYQAILSEIGNILGITQKRFPGVFGILSAGVFNSSGTLGKLSDGIVQPEEADFVVQADDSGTISVTVFEFNYLPTTQAFVDKIKLKIGDTAPVDPVKFELYAGTDSLDEDRKLAEKTVEPGDFTANSMYTLIPATTLGFRLDESVHVKISSNTAFDLKSNAAETFPYLVIDRQQYELIPTLSLFEWREKTYAKGDWIQEDRKIYVCNTAGAQTTSFAANAAKWDKLMPCKDIELFIHGFDGIASDVGNWKVNALTSADFVTFQFRFPQRAVSLLEAKILIIPDATETVQYDLLASIAGVGEDYNNDDRVLNDQTTAVTANKMTELDVSAVLGGMSPGDYAALKFGSNTNIIRVVGGYFRFKADCS